MDGVCDVDDKCPGTPAGTKVDKVGCPLEQTLKILLDYLSSRGVDPARMSSVGYGETRPIADNATDEGRQQNRRVMLIRTDTGM
jgi:hypothetical protein